MAGMILLEGGAEFGGRMREPDLRAIELAGGMDAPIAILPTAAAPDHNDRGAGQNGVRWMRSLGARQVDALGLIDPPSAGNPEIVLALRRARLIYLLGGFPSYLYQTLNGSPAWEAIQVSHQNGAVIGGSSAGAMVLGEYFYDPHSQALSPGLNLLPGICVLPHHTSTGKTWAPRLAAWLPEARLVGIDEQTGMLNDGPGGEWTVYGGGAVTVYEAGFPKTFLPGQRFSL